MTQKWPTIFFLDNNVQVSWSRSRRSSLVKREMYVRSSVMILRHLAYKVRIYINSIHIHIHIPLYMRLVLWSTGQVNSNSKTKSIVYVRALCLNVNYFTLIRFFIAFITRRWNGDGDDDDDDDARKQPKKRRVAAKSQSSTYCLKWRHSTNNCHRKNKSKAPLFLWPFNAILTRVCDKDLASKREK